MTLTCASSWSRFLSAAAFFCSSGSSSTQTSRPKCSRASFSCISRTCSSCSKEHSFPAPMAESRHSPPALDPSPLWSPPTPLPLTKGLQLSRVEVAEEAEQPSLHLADVGNISEEAVLQRGPPRRPRASRPPPLLARPARGGTEKLTSPEPRTGANRHPRTGTDRLSRARCLGEGRVGSGSAKDVLLLGGSGRRAPGGAGWARQALGLRFFLRSSIPTDVRVLDRRSSRWPLPCVEFLVPGEDWGPPKGRWWRWEG